jgi:hypothetical protein
VNNLFETSEGDCVRTSARLAVNLDCMYFKIAGVVTVTYQVALSVVGAIGSLAGVLQQQ